MWSVMRKMISSLHGQSHGGEYDVAPCGACRPWIFFINEVLCFFNIMVAEWRRKKDDWRCHFKEKMSQEEAHHHKKPWIKA